MTDIQITGLQVDYGDRPVLQELALSVPAGSVTAVLGSSGCGKSTLLRAVAGLLRPRGGVIRLGDEVVSGDGRWVRTQRRGIGLVPQEGGLFPHLDVAGNVGFALRGRGRSRAERIAELLTMVGLPGIEALRPHQLSGGMQQRVAVARALSHRPRVVLLDEPFSALDTSSREQVRRDVVAAIRSDGATALLVTHDQDEALGLADRVAVMRDGRIVQEGTPTEVYATPVDAEVATFVGDSALLPAVVIHEERPGPHPTRVECALGTVSVRRHPEGPAHGDRGVVLLRPEEVLLTASPDRGDAVVSDVRYHGHDTLVSVVLDAGPTLAARVLGGPVLRPGERVDVRLTQAPLFLSQHPGPRPTPRSLTNTPVPEPVEGPPHPDRTLRRAQGAARSQPVERPPARRQAPTPHPGP